MKHRHSGFTIIELVVTIVVGAILTSIALSSFGSAQTGRAVRGARDTFVGVHARARAHAIELGNNVRFEVHVNGDSIRIVDSDGNTLEKVDFSEEMGVELRASGLLRLCMSPRGYADEGCNNFTTGQKVAMWAGTDSASVEMLPLGQLIY